MLKTHYKVHFDVSWLPFEFWQVMLSQAPTFLLPFSSLSRPLPSSPLSHSSFLFFPFLLHSFPPSFLPSVPPSFTPSFLLPFSFPLPSSNTKWLSAASFLVVLSILLLEKAMATHCSARAWRIPGRGEPGGLPSLGSHRVGHD